MAEKFSGKETFFLGIGCFTAVPTSWARVWGGVSPKCRQNAACCILTFFRKIFSKSFEPFPPRQTNVNPSPRTWVHFPKNMGSFPQEHGFSFSDFVHLSPVFLGVCITFPQAGITGQKRAEMGHSEKAKHVVLGKRIVTELPHWERGHSCPHGREAALPLANLCEIPCGQECPRSQWGNSVTTRSNQYVGEENGV